MRQITLDPEGEIYLTARQVMERYSICPMTLYRWLRREINPFPAPIFINKRRYFRLREIEAFERAHVCGTDPHDRKKEAA